MSQLTVINLQIKSLSCTNTFYIGNDNTETMEMNYPEKQSTECSIA